MSMAFLYGLLIVVAFGFFAVVLAVVAETTERYLKQRDPNRLNS